MDQQAQEALLADLARSQDSVLALAAKLSPEQWQRPVYSDGAVWSAADIYRHLLDAQSGMTRLMELILAGGEGVPADFDRERWNARAVEKRRDLTIAELTEQMIATHERLLAFIASLQPADWDKAGRHASLRIMSIAQICQQIADHKKQHTEDIERELGAI